MTGEFDVAIIGGGILGAGCALELSRVGKKVCLLDKSDFGGETSANSFKIIHGGIRYLQHLDVPRLLESADAQKKIRLRAPHLVKPLPILVPVYGYGLKGREALRFACSVYEWIEEGRNDGLPEYLHLPNHQVLTVEETLQIAPHLKLDGLRGAVVFYDVQMLRPERLMMSVLKTAESYGSILRNHCELTDFDVHQGMIRSAKMQDLTSNTHFSVKAKQYLLALGPWGEDISRFFSTTKKALDVVYSKGLQLVLPEIVQNYALAFESTELDDEAVVSRGGRSYFLQPWSGHTLAGTTDTIFRGDPSDCKIGMEEMRLFLKELYSGYPSGYFKPMHVRHAFGGLRPVTEAVRVEVLNGGTREGLTNTLRHEEIVDHSKQLRLGAEKIDNLLSIRSVKYTTFEKVAERVTKIFCSKLNASYFPSGDYTYVDAQNEKELAAFYERASRDLPDLPVSIVSEACKTYGSESGRVISTLVGLKKSAPKVPLDLLWGRARVVYAQKYEHAKSLSDVVLRRFGMGALGFPGNPQLETVAKHMAAENGWTSARIAAEIQAVQSQFNFEP